MGLETAALVAMGVGTAANAYNTWQNNRTTKKELNRRTGIAEQYATPWLEGDITTTFGEGYNVGQDALMQMLRADPSTKAGQTLQGMIETGNPFDTSNVFATLNKLDTRKRREALADVRAGAGGLGQRFGTAMMREEGDILAQLLEQSEGRDAQIAMGAYEAAQGRRMQGLGLQNNIANLLMQHGQGVNQGRLNALSLLLGLPMPQAGSYGGSAMDLGQLLLIANSMNQPK